MLSNKAKYALRALLALARERDRGPVLISEVARRESIPPKFLEVILLELKRHGIVQSKKGRGGGYQLRTAPQDTTYGRVIRILDGPLAPVSCVSVTAYTPCETCPDEASCGVRLVMKQVRDSIAAILDRVTLADVVKQLPRTPRSPRTRRSGPSMSSAERQRGAVSRATPGG